MELKKEYLYKVNGVIWDLPFVIYREFIYFSSLVTRS